MTMPDASATVFIPQADPDELQALLDHPRLSRPSYLEAMVSVHDDEARRAKGFQFRRPFSDILLRWLVVLIPLALGAIAGLLGIEFQRHAESFASDGLLVDVAAHVRKVRDLRAVLGVICVVGLVAMALWSALIMINTNRVAHSLRTPWFAAIGWLIAPGAGLAAHLTLDSRLESGSLVGFAVFLAVLYIPFGTLGGAAQDLGGSAHLARTWFTASAIGAFLLIFGMSGGTSVLPVEDPENVFKVRAFTCYLAALMLAAASAIAFATARDMNALIGHRWSRENDPQGLFSDPKRLKMRNGSKVGRPLTPTLFLRIIIAVGITASGIAGVLALFAFRGRYLQSGLTAIERQTALDDHAVVLSKIGVVGVALHLVYMVWAVVAARNARRRSIMAPSAWAVVGAFFSGPVIVGVGFKFLSGPFGAAVVTIGVIVVVAGFVIGQLVLGRSVSSLDGRGRIFLLWMLIDFAMILLSAFIAEVTDTRVQTIAYGVALTALTLVSAATAWTATSRLDRACRSYEHFVPAVDTAAMSTRSFQPISLAEPVGVAAVFGDAS